MFAGWFLRGGGATSPEQARGPRRRAPPGRRGDPGSASREAPRSATRSPARAVCWRSAPRWSAACVAEVVGRGGPPLASVQRWPCCAEGSLSTLSWRRGWGLQPGFYESPGGERWSRCHQGASLGGRPEPGSGLRLCRQARQRLVRQTHREGLTALIRLSSAGAAALTGPFLPSDRALQPPGLWSAWAAGTKPQGQMAYKQ